MATSWGNEGHGPGGDPSWLGGKDRGRDGVTPQSGADGKAGPLPDSGDGWSSDFGAGSARRSADSDFDASASPSQAPEHSAPRFGSFGEGGVDGSDREQRQLDAQVADATRTPTLKQILGALVPTVAFVVIAIVFFRADFSFWWIAFVVILPTVRRLTRLFGGTRRR